MKETLYYELLRLDSLDFVIAPVNLLLTAGIVLTAWLAIRVARRSFITISDKTALSARRSNAIFKLTKNSIIITASIFIIQGLNINNSHFNFSDFLEYDLITIDTFHLSVYHLLLAVVAFMVTRVFLNIFQIYLTRNISNKDWIDEGKKFTIFQLVKYFTYTVVVIMLVRSTGVQMSLLLTSAAALFVGIGLGLQTIFADLVSGFMLLFDGSVRVGDTLEIDGEMMSVRKINIRFTEVALIDDATMLVPNSKITTNIVKSRGNKSRLTRHSIPVRVMFGSDTQLVRQLLMDAAKAGKPISSAKKPTVFFTDFGENGMHFELYFWTSHNMQHARIKSDIRFEIDRLFREHGIKVPVPQREVKLESVSPEPQ